MQGSSQSFSSGHAESGRLWTAAACWRSGRGLSLGRLSASYSAGVSGNLPLLLNLYVTYETLVFDLQTFTPAALELSGVSC